jgi:hypothetical protein
MPDLEVVSTSPAPAPAAPKRYRASIFPDEDIAVDFAEMILALEKELDLKIWCLVQQGEDGFDEMGVTLYKGFLERKEEIVLKRSHE